MTQDLSSLSLDELFKEARQALGKQRAAAVAPSKQRRATAETPEVPSSCNLANWTRTRGVTLIHQETRTVLGNFTEYTHNALPGARRLLREVEVLPFTAVEYVTGVWGERPAEPVATPRLWKCQREAQLDIVFKEMGVSAPFVEVTAYFGEGVLERVTLVDEITFYGAPKASAAEHPMPSFCILPAGTNILPEMSAGSIKYLLTQLGQPT
jgi:hypothetical protein